jgi:hypothetical protein
MSKTVQIMGGPEDGRFLELRDNVRELKMAVHTNPTAPTYIEVRLPIESHSGRWYAVWKEPKC